MESSNYCVNIWKYTNECNTESALLSPAVGTSGSNKSSSSSRKQNYQGCAPLHIQAVNVDDQKSGKRMVKIRFRCNSMDLAAELIQDMAKHLNITDLEATADFPDELSKFEEVGRLKL